MTLQIKQLHKAHDHPQKILFCEKNRIFHYLRGYIHHLHETRMSEAQEKPQIWTNN